MKTKKCVIVGAGGLGRGVLDLLESINRSETDDEYSVVGVLDDNPSAIDLDRIRQRGYEWLGTMNSAKLLPTSTRFVLGVNDPKAKQALSSQLVQLGLLPLTLVHPRVELPSTTVLGAGVVIFGGVEISSNVALGDYVTVNRNITLGHDAVIESFTSINPGAAISGETTIGQDNLVGANAVILRGLETGRNVTIGALACVTKDVPSGRVAKGIPARW